jgi:hypothetical protein
VILAPFVRFSAPFQRGSHVGLRAGAPNSLVGAGLFGASAARDGPMIDAVPAPPTESPPCLSTRNCAR